MKVVSSKNGRYEIFDNYVIARYNEGVDITPDNEGDFIKELLKKHFQNEFGWISDRVNSYSFSPFLIKYVANEFDNLKYFASVSYNKFSKKNEFANRQFPSSMLIRDFEAVPSAISWILSNLN